MEKTWGKDVKWDGVFTTEKTLSTDREQTNKEFSLRRRHYPQIENRPFLRTIPRSRHFLRNRTNL
eukprot:22016-Amphidinium_carterae.1